MPHVASDPALKAIADWWSDMGVEPDAALMKALVKARQAPTPSPQQGQDRAVPARRTRARATPQDRVAEAQVLARNCDTLDALKAAIEAFDGSALKAGSNRTVVHDGVPNARVMVIGEGPGEDDDKRGLPFVGRAGQLLDRMLAAIDLSRAENTLITNVNYWRPPGNRNPEPDELAVCRPFVDRMITIVAPKLIISAGDVPTKALLDTSDGIMKTHGRSFEYAPPGGAPVPLFPIFHPAFLLGRPIEKSRAWRDLLAIEARLRELSD